MAKMAKKSRKYEKKNGNEKQQKTGKDTVVQEKAAFDKLPKDVQEKLKAIKTKLDKFQKQALDKFDKYIAGITLLPPPKPEEQKEQKQEDKDRINVLVLIDDSDSRKMSKFELKDKLSVIMGNIAQEIDKNLVPQTVILSELLQNCYYAKY